MIDEGLSLAITDLLPVEFDTKGNHRVKLVLVVNRDVYIISYTILSQSVNNQI